MWSGGSEPWCFEKRGARCARGGFRWLWLGGLRRVSKRVERALLVWSATGGELGWRMETCWVSLGGGLESDSFALSGAGLVELRADVDSRSLWWTIIMSGLGSHFVKYDPCWILRLIKSLNILALVSKDRNIKATKWR